MSRRQREDPPRHVIGVDGSEFSDEAFRWANKRFPENDIFVVYHGWYGMPLVRYSAPEISMKEVDKAELARHAKIIDHYASLCTDLGRKCVFEEGKYNSIGELSDKICRTAHDFGAQDVIVGARGAGRWSRMVLGSVSNSVVHNPECSDIATIIHRATNTVRYSEKGKKKYREE